MPRPGFSRTFQRAISPLMLLTAATLFAAGAVAPFFTVTQFWMFHDAVSVVAGLRELFRAGEWFLFTVILVFTLVFPAAKLIGLGMVWSQRGRNDARADRLLHRVSSLGKWSMLDVFVVAILVVVLKSASVARVQIEVGVYLFTASVVLTQILSFRLERRLGRIGRH